MRSLIVSQNTRLTRAVLQTRLFAFHGRSMGSTSSFSTGSWPEGAKAFQRKLVSTLDPGRRQGRRPSKLEIEEVIKELDIRMSSNKLSASGIADIMRAVAETQTKLMKSRRDSSGQQGGGGRSRETYIKPLRENNKGDGSIDEVYSSQFHPTLLNLVSNFVRIMGSQREKGSFNGVLFKYVANGMYRMQVKWDDLGDAQKPFLYSLARACPSIRKQDLDFIMGTLGGGGAYLVRHPP